MTRMVVFFPESNTAPLKTWQEPINNKGIEELKKIANNYPNKHIYTDQNGNLCIDYGRYKNKIIAN